MLSPVPAYSRRRALKTLFCSSALFSLNLRSGSALVDEKAELDFLMIGDFGSMEPAQTAVAKGMANYVKSKGLKPDALLLLGDNFYKEMKGGLKSKRWQEGFELMYPSDVFPGPCPAILGNHDYHDNEGGEQVQLAYAHKIDTRWKMPHKWYRLDFPAAGQPLVTMLFLDTNLRSLSRKKKQDSEEYKNSLKEDEENAQWQWLESQLKSQRAPFTIVCGHHPVYSNGHHGDSAELVKTLAPMLQEHDVHLYLCGHDHDLQHLELEGQKTSFILSGGGGARVREMTNNKRKQPYGKQIYGFSHLQAAKDKLTITHYDANAKALHRLVKSLDHKWETVS